jgi:hypothetical protein
VLSKHSYIAIVGSLSFHIIFLLLVKQHAASFESTKGIPLPAVVIEVSLHAPEAEKRISPADEGKTEPNVHQAFELAHSSIALDSDRRLLTPPPTPIGTDAPETRKTLPGFGFGGVTYYPTSKLTIRPVPTTRPIIELPEGWLEAFGQTVLTLYINSNGTVDEVIVRRTELDSELHHSIIAAFKKLSFVPGELNGVPVASVMTIDTYLSASISDNN